MVDGPVQGRFFGLQLLGAEEVVNLLSDGLNHRVFSNLLRDQCFQLIRTFPKQLGQNTVGPVLPFPHDILHLTLNFYNALQVFLAPGNGVFPFVRGKLF